jgi:NADH:ubiquinone oxidoreductase subunit D
VAASREAAAALERVKNYLWWAVRFFGILETPSLVRRSWELAGAVSAVVGRMWERPALEWAMPRGGAAAANQSALAEARQVNNALWAFCQRVKANRMLKLRTRGIGVLAEDQLRQASVEGPVLQVAQQYGGDVHGRLLARLEAAARDLNQAVDIISEVKETSGKARWQTPSGKATAAVMGPRGRIGIRLVSEGRDGPADVQWARPSAALLELVPQTLRGQRVADAEVILASLDLAMAEADG